MTVSLCRRTLEELHMSKNKLCRLCGIQNFYPHLQTLDVTDNRIASLAELVRSLNGHLRLRFDCMYTLVHFP